MNDTNLLDLLKRMAEAIVAVVGPHCEVVVHDFSDLEHSAVAIAGNVTGRKSGAPIPDLDFISKELDSKTPDQLNYRIKINSKEFQSSTVWVRDSKGKPVGAVCINVDYSSLINAGKLIDHLTGPARQTPSLVVKNTLAKDLDELIEHALIEFMERRGIEGISDMTQADRLELMTEMDEHGLFQLRGAAQCIATALGVSRASIYNYRSMVKDK